MKKNFQCFFFNLDSMKGIEVKQEGNHRKNNCIELFPVMYRKNTQLCQGTIFNYDIHLF